MLSRILLVFLCFGLLPAVPESYAAGGGDKDVKVEKKRSKKSRSGKSKEPGGNAQKGEKKEKAAPLSPFDQELLADFDMPAKCPKMSDSQMEELERKYDDLLELYSEIKALYGDLDELMNVEDERELRHNQGKIRKTNGRIKRTKQALVRKVKQRYRPLQRRQSALLENQKKNESRLKSAEKSGNDQMARKINRELERREEDLAKVQSRMDMMHYLLFWNFSKGKKK